MTASMSASTGPADPRSAVNTLDDATPFLLLPVRLETRFAAGPAELWVRVYPDDCLVDTFDPVLTDGEVANGQVYWRRIWLAYGDQGLERAAWRELVAAHGSGRAGWIVDSYAPTNPGDKPTQSTDNPPQPVFPAVATRPHPWAIAPHTTMLPQRFVFIGYPAGGGAPVVVVGNPVPPDLQVGPDGSATGPDQLRPDGAGGLSIPDGLAWVADFDRAVAIGMAMRVPLDAAQARGGFDRVLVLGVRLGEDAATARSRLEDLLRHHAYGRTGLAVLAQGTATNNTEQAPAGHDRGDDPDATFDRTTARYTTTPDAAAKRDGQWLAEHLGVAGDFFAHTAGAEGTDQLTVRAMSRALWPATLGYWMRTMLAPVFDDATIARTRDFFGGYVFGSGTVPALRIGNQPYGVLPTTAFSRMSWFERGGDAAFLRGLHDVLEKIRADWAPLVPGVSRVGGAGDPHQLLLDIVGQHPFSVEWYQRYAESLTSLFNRLNLDGFGGLIAALLISAERSAAKDVLTRLGYAGAGEPPILGQVEGADQNLLTGGVVDDRPLSTLPVREYTVDHRNYLRWLADAARSGIDALYQQDGFVGDQPPAALLYLMLRHALQLGYHDASVRLHVDAGLYTVEQAAAAVQDSPFLHIRTAATLSESRYQPLYEDAPAITGRAGQSVADYIVGVLGAAPDTTDLSDQIAAIERLVDQSTIRLEGAFAGHVDTLSYRLDAWLLGLVNLQLGLMRGLSPGGGPQLAGGGAASEGGPRTGVHLGAFAWLEDLRPDPGTRTPVQLDDDLAADFTGPGLSPLTSDSTNEGYVHAPSLNQAVAAAVLRSGYAAGSDALLGVTLTSARVRGALNTLEGIRSGQSLSDLLGYQFERGLHDRHGAIEVDRFIGYLRKAFPLRADRMASTRTGDGVAIEAIEASNVMDGLALVERIKAGAPAQYPFGVDTLPAAGPDEAAAIDAEAARLLDTHDAVADLALAEGVYQAVQGNYDRVAATYDAYAQGRFPPEPDVVRTPRPGVGLTARLALHLRTGLDPTVSPVPGVAMTPRAAVEPAVNDWLATVLPPLGTVGCVVTVGSTVGGGTTGGGNRVPVTLQDLGLQPQDLVAILREDTETAMSEVDDRILRRVRAATAVRPDDGVSIAYRDAGTAPVSFFEALPLLRSLRTLTTASRPLRASDLTLAADAVATQDDAPDIDAGRLDALVTGLTQLRTDLQAYTTAYRALLADPVANREAILSTVDDRATDLVELLARAAGYGLPQCGWSFAYGGLRRGYAGIKAACADLVTRWDGRVVEFQGLLEQDTDAPSPEERTRVLTAAERAISTVPLPPQPPDAFRAALLSTVLPAFEARRQAFAAIATSTRTAVAGLRDDVLALLPIAAFDAVAFGVDAVEAGLLTFAGELLAVGDTVAGAVDRRLADAQPLLARAATLPPSRERVDTLQSAATALLGDGVLLVPEFTVDAPVVADQQAAIAASRDGSIFAHLGELDFPVDTWLHGVARVRDKAAAWESTQLMASAFAGTEPSLDALMLPFVPGQGWLGLDLPPGPAPAGDRLLYTAHFPADPTTTQCGLLLDEWSELIPGPTVETGLTLNYDRPSSEAPQAMLLVTPTQFRGAWQWEDLVDALNETLDLAKLRGIEPSDVDTLPYAWFLPATVMATQARQLTIAADLALNNPIRVAEG